MPAAQLESENLSNGSTPTQRSLPGLGSGVGIATTAPAAVGAAGAGGLPSISLTWQSLGSGALGKLLPTPVADGSSSQSMLRATTMENILAGMQTLSGLGSLDESLLNWGSLPQDVSV